MSKQNPFDPKESIQRVGDVLMGVLHLQMSTEAGRFNVGLEVVLALIVAIQLLVSSVCDGVAGIIATFKGTTPVYSSNALAYLLVVATIGVLCAVMLGFLHDWPQRRGPS